MKKEKDTLWIERFFRRVHFSYLIAALIAGVFLLLYWLLSLKVYFHPWILVVQLPRTAQCVLVGVELAGLYYFFGKIKYLFSTILPDLFEPREVTSLTSTWKAWFYNSRDYYLLIILLFIPFTLQFTGFQYFNAEHTIWSIILDLYVMFVGYFVLFLLAIIIWIIFHIVLLLREISSRAYLPLIHLNMMAADSYSGLKPVHDLGNQLLIFYFLCITLAIISVVSPFFTLFSVEGLFFISLMILGLALFVVEIISLRRILRGRIEEKINEFYEYYSSQEKQLLDLIEDTSEEGKIEKINLVQAKLDALLKQRERMVQEYSNSKGYTLVTLFEVSSSFILALIAFIEKILQFSAETGIGSVVKNLLTGIL